MIVYLDTSAVMRTFLGETGAWDEWKKMRQAYSCELLPIEIGRVIDRMRLNGAIDDAGVVHLQMQTRAFLRSVSLIYFDASIRDTAAGAMPTVLGTLDALHLASALALRRSSVVDLSVFVTHDQQLGAAARAYGFSVVGC